MDENEPMLALSPLLMYMCMRYRVIVRKLRFDESEPISFMTITIDMGCGAIPPTYHPKPPPTR